MQCKFFQHGIAISYNQIVKPCCTWNISDTWRQENHLSQVNLVTWHNNAELQRQKQQLESEQWPQGCSYCEHFETNNRDDSIRLGGNRRYHDYQNDDVVLEIRPGSTCNFACQTCWPQASSRVAQYYHQAGIIDIKDVDTNTLDDFEFIKPIAHRIRDVILLGGEPFYDKACRRFLAWAQENLTSNLTLYTNGSQIDFDFVKNYPGKLILVFSIDAVGRPAEYIRVGTDWPTVLSNYRRAQEFNNVEVRVNVTCSVYNLSYLPELIDFLCEQWPAVVTFGRAEYSYLTESSIPLEYRTELIQGLARAAMKIAQTDIESGQKDNAINALKFHVESLKQLPWVETDYNELKSFVAKMDRVKNLNVADYCEFLTRILQPLSRT